ncbi:MAG TPA: hypothetical protein PLS10_10775, partial [Chitinophagales bacterium]|nr:hypothetical protein [Chitinophagales bacterium]
MKYIYKKIFLSIIGLLFMYCKANAQTYNMPSGTVSTCSGTFYDPGGTSNYGNSLDRTFTICPSTPGSFASITFTQFSISQDLLFGNDYLYVYDGNSTSAPLEGIYSGNVNPGTITATSSNPTGCLTFRFTSTALINAAGWTATISCTTTPPQSYFCGGVVEYPFCTGTSYNYQNTTGTTGPAIDYACLGTWPNPKFFYMKIGTSGTFKMQIRQTTGPNNTGTALDVDFAMWGPFSSLSQACTSVAGGAAPIQSSYDIQSIETVGIGTSGGTNSICAHGIGQSTPPAAIAGQYYVIVITNYSDLAGYITFTQTGGTGSTDCSIISPTCSITGITATPTNCNATNKYDVSGTVTVANGPTTGNLVITNSCGGSQSIAATGASSYNYNITGITSPTSATTCTITAQFSASASCTSTRTYSAPVTPTANAGSDVTISCATPSVVIGTPTVAGNTYSWSPAAGLTGSNTAQPTANTAGTYTLTVTNSTNSCSATDAVIVTNTSVLPTANAGPDKTLDCNNTSYVIGTAAVAGNTYSWSPSIGLSLNNVAQPTATAPGTYTLTVTNTATGCTATDAVTVSQNIT